MKKRVSKDKPAYLNEKNNLLDRNCTLNRYKLNDFRSSIEFLYEPCEHSHPIHEACFPSCKLHPFNRRYPGTHSLIKMNFIHYTLAIRKKTCLYRYLVVHNESIFIRN